MPDAGATLEFTECSVVISKSDGDAIPLVSRVSATVAAGRILAVMGPSGAGKTTLLGLLAGKPGSGGEVRYGSVWLNGQSVSADSYKRHCVLVSQFDRLWTFLTPYEQLRYAMMLYQPDLPSADRRAAILQLLSDTGLSACQDTRTGTNTALEIPITGLSGGQRRRLSLALALTKKPSVLLCDEVTSGLDSAGAAAIMTLLGELAHASGIATVSTIHQPSAAVYSGIDDLLLLSRGRTAYYGPANALEQYLESVKKPLPQAIGVAEHALDLFNGDFTSVEEVEQLLDAWTPKPTAPPMQSPLPTLPRLAGTSEQLWVLGQRHTILLVKDPTHYLLQMIGLVFDLTYRALAASRLLPACQPRTAHQ